MHLKDLGYALRPLGSAHSGPALSSRVSQPAYAWDVSQPSSCISAASLCPGRLSALLMHLTASLCLGRLSTLLTRLSALLTCPTASLCPGRLSSLLMCLSGQLMPGASLTQGICFTATTSLISSTVRPLGGEVRYPVSDDSLKDMAICPDGKKPDDETAVVCGFLSVCRRPAVKRGICTWKHDKELLTREPAASGSQLHSPPAGGLDLDPGGTT